MVSDNLTVENIYQNSNSSYHDFRRTLLQVFTPLSSSLIDAKGESSAVFGTLKQYNAGYRTDPDLLAIEQSTASSGVSGINDFTAFNLKGYDAWLNGYVGSPENLTMNYLSNKTDVAPGAQFQFVFDRQSGVEQTLDYLIQAPLGYGWAEAPGDSSVYSYHGSNLAPRTVITLTLTKTPSS